MQPGGRDAAPPHRWLISGSRPAVTMRPDAGVPAAVPALRTESAGALADRVTALASRLAPAGSTLLSAVQYPDLRAATASLGVGDIQLSLGVQRLPAPIYVTDLTLGFPADTVQDWPGGMRAIVFRHGLPHTFQVTVVRADGVRLTVTVFHGTEVAGARLFAPWSGVEALVARVRELAGDARLDW